MELIQTLQEYQSLLFVDSLSYDMHFIYIKPLAHQIIPTTLRGGVAEARLSAPQTWVPLPSGHSVDYTSQPALQWGHVTTIWPTECGRCNAPCRFQTCPTNLRCEITYVLSFLFCRFAVEGLKQWFSTRAILPLLPLGTFGNF